LIAQMQSLMAGSATRLLVASVRSREAYLALLRIGVGAVTIPPRLFAELIDHDATIAAERAFLTDAGTV
jgi:transaldolase